MWCLSRDLDLARLSDVFPCICLFFSPPRSLPTYLSIFPVFLSLPRTLFPQAKEVPVWSRDQIKQLAKKVTHKSIKQLKIEMRKKKQEKAGSKGTRLDQREASNRLARTPQKRGPRINAKTYTTFMTNAQPELE